MLNGSPNIDKFVGPQLAKVYSTMNIVYSLNASQIKIPSWYPDSATLFHITYDITLFSWNSTFRLANWKRAISKEIWDARLSHAFLSKSSKAFCWRIPEQTPFLASSARWENTTNYTAKVALRAVPSYQARGSIVIFSKARISDRMPNQPVDLLFGLVRVTKLRSRLVFFSCYWILAILQKTGIYTFIPSVRWIVALTRNRWRLMLNTSLDVDT